MHALLKGSSVIDSSRDSSIFEFLKPVHRPLLERTCPLENAAKNESFRPFSEDPKASPAHETMLVTILKHMNHIQTNPSINGNYAKKNIPP